MRQLALAIALVSAFTTSCMKQVVEPATVLRAGAIYTDTTGRAVKGLEVQFVACPDVVWGFYLEKAHPGADTMASSTATCLEKLRTGDKVDVAIDVKPLNKSGGTHGGSATRVGKCALRPKENDTYEGFLSTSNATAKTCPWARSEVIGP